MTGAPSPLTAVALLLGAAGCGPETRGDESSAPSSTPGGPAALVQQAAPAEGDVRNVGSGEGLEIAPYILDLGRDRVTVAWVTRRPSLGSLTLRGDGEPVVIAEEGEARRHHRLTVDGLTPGVTYAYEVDVRFRGTFETQPDHGELAFAVFGHPGGTQSVHRYPFEAVADAISRCGARFSICTGDACYETTERSFKEDYFGPLGRLTSSAPVYLVAGNHEAGFPIGEGVDYRVYRDLFPHDFGHPRLPYYTHRHGDVEFFSVAYGPLREGEFEPQMEWLARELARSEAEFRIVVWGGANVTPQFDRERFYEVASEGGADLVFSGDGSGVKVTGESGLDDYFAGTNNSQPHGFFLVRQDGYRLRVHQYDATMRSLLSFKTYGSRRAKTLALDLTDRLEPARTRANCPEGAVVCSGIDVPSTRFHGVRVTVTNPTDKPAVAYLHWAPDHITRGDGHYRERYRALAAGETRTLDFAIPARAPRTGEPFTLRALRVHIDGGGIGPGFQMGSHIEQVALFVDPLKDGE